MSLGGGPSIATQPTEAMGIDFQGAQYGPPISVVYGQNKVAGNCIWYGDFKATPNNQNAGKGGGPTITSYTYSASFQLAICEGAITGIANVYDGTSTVNVSALGGAVGTGAAGQAAWAHLSGAAALGYSLTAWFAVANMNLGGSPSLPNLNFEVEGLKQYNVGSGIIDANPADILNDICTDPNHGINLPYLGSLTQYSNYCVANGIFFSPVYNQQQTGQQVLQDLLKYSNSEAFYSEGLLKIVPRGDTAVTGNGVTYTPNTTIVAQVDYTDIITNKKNPPIKVTRKAPADCMNVIRVEFSDRTNTYHPNAVAASIDYDVLTYGQRAEQDESVNMITSASVAKIVAQNLLQKEFYVRNTYQFKLPWRFCYLEPMDLLELNDPNMGLVNWPVRITEVIEDEAGLLTITAEEYPAGVGYAVMYPAEANAAGNVDTNVDPGPVQAPYLLRGPGYLVPPTSYPQVWCAVVGTSAWWAGAGIYMSYDGSSYHYVGQSTRQARYGILELAAWAASTVMQVGELRLMPNGSTLQVTAVTSDDKTGTVAPVLTVVGNTTVDNHVTWKCIAVAYTAPGAPALSSVAGGSIAATTYYAKCTWVDPFGNETTAGTEANLAVAASHLLVVTQPARLTARAVSWKVYISTSTGTETLQSGVLPIATTTWTEPATGLVVGVSPPAANHTGVCTLPTSTDPDNTDLPAVVLYTGQLLGGTQADADNFATLAMVDSELISYKTSTLMADGSYELGYVRRGAYNSAIAGHGYNPPFVRLDQNIIPIPVDATLVNAQGTVWFKFLSFNIFGKTPRTLASETAYSYTIGTNNEVPDAPPAVANLTVTGVADGLYLRWTNANNAIVAATNIYRSPDNITWTLLDQVGGSATTYKDKELNGASYYYYIQQRSPLNQWGPNSNTASGAARYGMDVTGSGYNMLPLAYSLFGINQLVPSFDANGQNAIELSALVFPYGYAALWLRSSAGALFEISLCKAGTGNFNMGGIFQNKKYIFSVYVNSQSGVAAEYQFTVRGWTTVNGTLVYTSPTVSAAPGTTAGSPGIYTVVFDLTGLTLTQAQSIGIINLNWGTVPALNHVITLQGCMMEQQKGNNTTPSTYAIPGVNATDPSGSTQGTTGSTPVTVPAMTFAYSNSIAGFIQWTWGSFNLLRPDTSHTAIASGFQNSQGLANSTTYSYYPFFDEIALAVSFVGLNSGDPAGGGTPQTIAFSSAGNSNAANYMSLLGRCPLSAAGMKATSSAAGGGGGGGGGGGAGSCLHPTTVVFTDNRGWVHAGTLEEGDEVWTPKGWMPLRKAWREKGPGSWVQFLVHGATEAVTCTPNEPVYRPDGSYVRASELRLRMAVDGGDGLQLFVESLREVTDDQDRICTDVGGDHTFFLWPGGPRLHNQTQKP